MFRGDKYVTPLCRIEDDDVPEQGASGVWIAIGHERFLVTAAHAIDEGFIWFPMEKGHKRIDSPGVLTTPPNNRREDDKADLAVFHLSAQDVAAKHPFHEFVGMEMIDVNLNYRFRDRYEFTGFPHRRGRLDRKARTIEPGYMSVNSESMSESDFAKHGLNIRTHVAIAYDRKRMMKDGMQYTAPLPHGISGGAVWKRYEGSDDRKLAAIAIEFPGNCLVGTRISGVLEFIRAVYPELSPLIPRPRDVDVHVTKSGKTA